MSEDVDNRVVHMEFDNAAFSSKISDTIRGLDKLQQSLKMSEGVKGMADVQKSMSSFDSSAVTRGIEGISMKFLAMSTIAITAISGVVTKLGGLASQMAQGFTLSPIKDGFSEYETNIGSIQTILANTDRYGTKLPEVTANLDALNEYSDKTIYNFGEMVKNIGLFTNSGIRIGDATSMIKGFSNAAAASGTTAEGAASAAYQLSQALSNGEIRVMDWKSLTTVGMGNKNMQQGLIELADSMGTIDKAGTSADEVAKGFNESLEKGWLSADVMSNYLKIMAGDLDAAEMATMGLSEEQIKWFQRQQKIAEESATKVRTFTQLIGTVKESIGSGWSQTFKTLLGDFEGATNLFSGINGVISNMVSNSADRRKQMLEDWAAVGGRSVLFEGIAKLFESIKSIINPIRLAFREMFPRKTAGDLYKLTTAFRDFAEKLKIGEESGKKLYGIFKGVFGIFRIAGQVLKGVFGIFSAVFGILAGGPGKGAATAMGSLGEAIGRLADGGGITEFFSGLTDKIVAFVSVLGRAATAVKDFFVNLFGGKGSGGGDKKGNKSLDKMTQSASALGETADKASSAWQSFVNGIKSLGSGVANVAKAIGDFFGGLGSKIGDALSSGNFTKVLVGMGITAFGILAKALHNFSKDGFQFDFFGGLGERIGDTLTEVQDTLKSFQLAIKAEALRKIAIALAILVGAILVLALIPEDRLKKSLLALTAGMAELVIAMKQLQGTTKDMLKISVGLIALSVAVLILAAAMVVMSFLDWEAVGKGFAALSAMLVGMVLASKGLDASGDDMMKASLGLIAMSLGLVIFTFAIKRLSDIPFMELVKGIGGAAVGLRLLSAAMNSIPDDMGKKGIGFLLASTSINLVAKAVEAFGKMSAPDLLQGVLALQASLAALDLFINSMPPGVDKMALALVALGASVYVIAQAISVMGGMKFTDLLKGVGALGAMMLILAVGVNAMSGAQVGALAIVVVAGAIAVLAGVIKLLGELSLAQIITGILAFALALGVIALVAYAIMATGAVLAIMSLGVAMQGLGVALLLMGGGALLAAMAIGLFAKNGVKGFETFMKIIDEVVGSVKKFGKLIVGAIFSIVEEFVMQFPQLLMKLLELGGMILDGLQAIFPKLMETVGVAIDQLLILLAEKGPALTEAGFNLLVGFLENLRARAAEISGVATGVVASFIEGIANNIESVVGSAVMLLTSWLNGIASHAEEIAGAGVNVILGFIGGIAANMFQIATKATELVTQFITTISANSDSIVTAGVNAILDFLEGIGQDVQQVIDKGVEIVGKFIEGVGNAATDLVTAAGEALVDFMEGIETWIRDNSQRITDAGAGIAGAIVDGIAAALGADSAIDLVKDAVGGLADLIPSWAKDMLGIKSPSKVMMEIGGHVVAGLVQGLDDKGSAVANQSKGLATTVMDSFRKTLSDLSGAIGDPGDIQPVIAPVLDLTQVESEAKKLAGMMGVDTLVPTTSMDHARLIALSDPGVKSETEGGPVTQNNTFIQNNTSPKALTEADLYRQTKGLFATTLEELKSA